MSSKIRVNAKNLLTAVLLLFVVASLVAVVVRGGRPDDEPPPLADGLVVYYFHSNARCTKCRNIEAYAHEAVEGVLRQRDTSSEGDSPISVAQKSGQSPTDIQWRVVDYQQPGNEHFADEYQVVAPTVVLVQMRGGVATKHKNLMQVWDMVEDKQALIELVQSEIRSMLAEE